MRLAAELAVSPTSAVKELSSLAPITTNSHWVASSQTFVSPESRLLVEQF